MTLVLSWGIQGSHEMPRLIHPVSFETPYTTSLSELFCTTKLRPTRLQSDRTHPAIAGQFLKLLQESNIYQTEAWFQQTILGQGLG